MDDNYPIATYDTNRKVNFIIEEIRDLYNYRALLKSLIWQNVTNRYKRSAIGIFWAFLDPLITMTVMSIIYTALLRRPAPAFPVFLFSGLLAWNFFSQSSILAVAGLMRADSLMEKVYIPKSVFAFSVVAGGLANLLLSFIPLAVLMIYFGRPFTIALLFLPVSLIIISMLTLGSSLIFSTLAVFYRDVQNYYQLMLRLVFYFSGIIYSQQHLPDNLQKLVKLVPTYHLVLIFRDPIYEGILPPLNSVLYVLVFSIFSMVSGFIIFASLRDKLLEKI